MRSEHKVIFQIPLLCLNNRSGNRRSGGFETNAQEYDLFPGIFLATSSASSVEYMTITEAPLVFSLSRLDEEPGARNKSPNGVISTS